MKKHILHIVENNSVPTDVRVWSEVLTAKEMGYEVSVICPAGKERDNQKFEEIDGIKIYRYEMPIEGNTAYSFMLEYLFSLFWEIMLSIRIYRKNSFHIIHSANPPDHVFLIALLFKPLKVKYIFDHHDIAPETYVAKFGKKNLFYKILLWMEKASFKTADVVISTNESYKKIALTRGKKKEFEVFVVRNGPDLTRIRVPRPSQEHKNGFRHLVAYVGIINNQEGIDHLLRAARYIIYDKKIRDIKFVIVGTGPYWREMVNLSKELNIDKFVTLTGFIPDEDLYEILSSADICVNPEFRNEFTDKSTMIKIMEYMVFGKPIVQFETTEGKVTAGEAAYYVKANSEIDFAEAIVELLNDELKRKKMGEIGKKRIIETLQWSIQKHNLIKAYEYVFGRSDINK